MKRIIQIEWRNPRSQYERGCRGITRFWRKNGKVVIKRPVRIFINKKLNAPRTFMEMAAFFHEVTHAYFKLHNVKISRKEEERFATKTGLKICMMAMRLQERLKKRRAKISKKQFSRFINYLISQ